MGTDKFQELTIVLTGASSGIGRAAAQTFAELGANLVLAARDRATLEKVAEECRLRGGRATTVTTDVTDPEAVVELAKTASSSFNNRIDVWINNAGIGTIGEFTETPIESHDQVIRTNLMGYLHGAHAVVPYFMRQQRGILINVNSLGGWVPAPLAVSYAASKFGLRGYSEALRIELSDWSDIHVCDVFPAFIDTPGLRHASNHTGRRIKPLPPLYDPYDVAKAMVSLIESPRPTVAVGQSAVIAKILYSIAPRLVGRIMNRSVRRMIRKSPPAPVNEGNLFAASGDTSVYGNWKYDRKSATPIIASTCLAIGVAAGIFLRRLR